MLTYVEPRTGRTQQVQKRERVRIAILERIGWRLLVEVEPEPTGLPHASTGPPQFEDSHVAASTGADLDRYDQLNAREAIEYLRSLNLDEQGLHDMYEYEAYNKRRVTVLRALGDE